MNIRFIDTSIVMNLLRIPHMCQEYESVKKEFNEAIEQNETLILPLATIIESWKSYFAYCRWEYKKRKSGKISGIFA